MTFFKEMEKIILKFIWNHNMDVRVGRWRKLSAEKLMFLVLDKTLESSLDCKEIQPVRPKGNQSWIFMGRTDAEAETPILWSPHVKSWVIGKDPDAEKDWGQEEKGMTKDEMAGWHHWLNGREFEWTPGVGDGQGGLMCCDSWGRKESDMSEQMNCTKHLFQGICFLRNIIPYRYMLRSLTGKLWYHGN